LEFFVREAAAEAAARLSGTDAEVLAFEEEANPDAIGDALLNRSLFSSRRLVRLDISSLLGTESPARLLTTALEAWEKGTPSGRREAFRSARALLSALQIDSGTEEERAQNVAKRVRRKEAAQPLSEILRAFPEEKASRGSILMALRLLLGRANDGTVALLTAVDPPAGVDPVGEIARQGLVLEVSIGEKDSGAALTRLARARARDREVAIESPAIDRLRTQTDGSPELFVAELEKLLSWAGPGGRVRAEDVREQVADDASEDLYLFFDAVGRREAGEALARLAELFSGRSVRAGDRAVETDDYWPVHFFGLVTAEVRRMLLFRSAWEPQSPVSFDASMSYSAFQTRLLPALERGVEPWGRSPFSTREGQISPFLWYKVAQRASRYSAAELARALARSADIDVRLKSSAPPLELLSIYVAELIAGV
jgi:DNA polymerase III delta subunit